LGRKINTYFFRVRVSVSTFCGNNILTKRGGGFYILGQKEEGKDRKDLDGG